MPDEYGFETRDDRAKASRQGVTYNDERTMAARKLVAEHNLAVRHIINRFFEAHELLVQAGQRLRKEWTYAVNTRESPPGWDATYFVIAVEVDPNDVINVNISDAKAVHQNLPQLARVIAGVLGGVPFLDGKHVPEANAAPSAKAL